MPYLPEDDQAEEREFLRSLESKASEALTTKERASAARPMEAGDYCKLWDPFRVAQRIFKEEVDKIDGQCRDKGDKKSIGARTKAIRGWWNSLDKEKKEEAVNVAAIWNADGAPAQKQVA